MKCAACGYNDEDAFIKSKVAEEIFSGELLEEIKVYAKLWIELTIVERGPFFYGTPYDWPAGKSCAPAVMRGTPTKILACPQCGTVKIEV